MSGFKAEYFADLASREAENFWFKARNELILWALQRYFPDFERFLEVGCGTGFVLQRIAAAHPLADLVGSELFTEGLDFARRRVPAARFACLDARSLPFRREFDVLGAFDVVEHIEEDRVALQNFREALRPGGGLLLTVPQHPWLWSAADDYACHERRYTAPELRDKLRKSGFEVLRSTSFVTLLLPAMLASRWRKGSDPEHFDPMAEFNLAESLNRAFLEVMRAERAMIRLGVDFPAGGSRLIVARKT